MKLNRRETIALLGGLALPSFAQKKDDYLLLDQAEIDGVLAKAKRCPWAAEALQQLLARAEAVIAKPMEIPDRGGQWGHWYTCGKDGSPLVMDSPTRHRCPKCNTIYSGEPYDSIYTARVHGGNSSAVRDLGLAFRFTGREEFAKRAAALLAGYAEKYSSYPRHDPYNKDSVNSARVMSQALDESTWITPMAWGYTMVRSIIPGREAIEETWNPS